MNIKEILQFIKLTLEANVIAAVKSIKEHTFLVKFQSNKVQVTNHPKFPTIQKTKEVNPVPVDKITAKQTKEIISSFEKQIALLQKEIQNVKTYPTVKVDNLKDIPKPVTEIKIKNPQKSVSITNFYEIQKELGKLKKAVESLKLNPTITVPDVYVPEVKIPEIKLPEPKVEIDVEGIKDLLSHDAKKPLAVRLSDGKKFYEALSEMADTIVSAGGGGKYAFQDTRGERTYGLVNILRQLMTVTEDRWGLNNTAKIGNITYTGEEDVDGNWIIRKVAKSGKNISMTYATKKNNSTINTYTEAWDARTTLTYGLFSSAFSLT